MRVKYLGSYEGNVGPQTRWQPGEVREVEDEDFAAVLVADVLWCETDEEVGGGLVATEATDEEKAADMVGGTLMDPAEALRIVQGGGAFSAEEAAASNASTNSGESAPAETPADEGDGTAGSESPGEAPPDATSSRRGR